MQIQSVQRPSKEDTAINVCDELLQSLRVSMQILFDKFDVPRLTQIARLVENMEGSLFCTGIGKSGVIAQKNAMTLSSYGIKSFYLSAQDALHGNIGVVSKGDLVIMLSKSGETQELLDLCPALRSKQSTIIAVVSNDSCRLAKASSHTFVLPELRELCPFDMAPTTSTLSQLIFGDLLAMTLMRLKKVVLDDFIQNHPAGRIGRRQILRVRDIMVPFEKMPVCFPSQTLCEILVELSNKQCGCICVLGPQEELLGIFTDGDLRRALQKFGPTAMAQPMHALMTLNPRTISPQELAYDAMRLMEEDQKRPITVLPVTEASACVGLIRMHDILQSGL
jgi:arabinose-5-phosphate isomerase